MLRNWKSQFRNTLLENEVRSEEGRGWHEESGRTGMKALNGLCVRGSTFQLFLKSTRKTLQIEVYVLCACSLPKLLMVTENKRA